ncbi:MAG: methylase, partial [Myxococcota bacterium]
MKRLRSSNTGESTHVTPDTKITRGKTQPERLALLDRYLILREWQLLERGEGVVVDVGFGEHAYTTAEMARRFRQLNTGLEIIGVEADPHRVDRARDAYPDIDFVTGGFPLSASVGRPARLVRAMNVLREYHPSTALDAYDDWAEPLTSGGLLLAGSSDKFGDTMTALVMRKTDERVIRESLLFSTTLEQGFGPWMFRDWLPRDLRRSAGEGDAVFKLLEQWHAAFEEARAAGHQAPKLLFCNAGERLAAQRDDVDWG